MADGAGGSSAGRTVRRPPRHPCTGATVPVIICQERLCWELRASLQSTTCGRVPRATTGWGGGGCGFLSAITAITPSLALARVFSKQLLSAAVSAIVLDALTDSTKAPMIHSTAATRGKEKASQRHRCVSGILDDEWGVPAVHAGGHLCEGPTSGYPLVQGCKGGPAARAAQQTQGPSRGVHPSEFRPCLPPPPPPPACRPWQGAPGCRSPEELLLVDGSSSQFVAGPGPWKSRA